MINDIILYYMHPGQLPPTWVLERPNSPLGRAPSFLISTYFSVAHTFGTNFISFLRVFSSNLWEKKFFDFLKIVWRNLALKSCLDTVSKLLSRYRSFRSFPVPSLLRANAIQRIREWRGFL